MKKSIFSLIVVSLFFNSFAFAAAIEQVLPVTVNGQLTSLLMNSNGEVFQILAAAPEQESLSAEEALNNYNSLVKNAVYETYNHPEQNERLTDLRAEYATTKSKRGLPEITFEYGSDLRAKKYKVAGRKIYTIDFELGDDLYPEFLKANENRAVHFLVGCTTAGKAPQDMVLVRRLQGETVCGGGARYVRKFNSWASFLGLADPK